MDATFSRLTMTGGSAMLILAKFAEVAGATRFFLERLAKQVRKRQQFRDQAVSAVGMERNSIYAIAFIMTGLFILANYRIVMLKILIK